MNAHRKMHSAESGQLIPRNRRHTADIPDYIEKRSMDDDVSSRILSWPHRDKSIKLSQKLPKKAERRMSPPAVPHRASIEIDPPSKVCPSAWTDRTQEFMNEKLAENRVPGAYVASTIASSGSSSTLSATTAPTEALSIPNTQTRKINDDFEVLPAGTLAKEPLVKSFGLWPPPFVEKFNTKKKQNKLKKRVRSDSVSSVSSTGSQPIVDARAEGLALRRSVC